jgi:hypothetical protein
MILFIVSGEAWLASNIGKDKNSTFFSAYQYRMDYMCLIDAKTESMSSSAMLPR